MQIPEQETMYLDTEEVQNFILIFIFVCNKQLIKYCFQLFRKVNAI